MERQAISTWRLLFLLLLILGAGVCGYWLQPLFHANAAARDVLVTLFSVLAGFLVAVMTLVSESRMTPGKNWKQGMWYLHAVRTEIFGHTFLFWLYLIILVLLFVDVLGVFAQAGVWAYAEMLTLGLSVLALALSFALPGQLTKRHMEALRQEILKRRPNL